MYTERKNDMRIYHISDLHLNHHVPFHSNQLKWEKQTKEWMRDLLSDVRGEVLVLNGDFSEWNVQTIWALEEASKHFNRVLFDVGNHDYYLLTKNQKKKYGTSFERIEELFDLAKEIPGVVCLHQRVYTYKGVTFAGDPMWYKLEKMEDKLFYENISNDSRYIHTGISFKATHRVLHDLSMDWYHSLAGQEIDVFVSHIPPIQPPMSPYKYNACYVTPVPFLVGKHWIAGHQHVQGTFEKAGTTFHMNAFGYPDENNTKVLQFFEV